MRFWWYVGAGRRGKCVLVCACASGRWYNRRDCGSGGCPAVILPLGKEKVVCRLTVRPVSVLGTIYGSYIFEI